MAVTPKTMWPAVKAMLHSVYEQPDTAAVHARFDRLLEYIDGKLQDVHQHLGAARADIIAFTTVPDGLRQQIWSSNLILNTSSVEKCSARFFDESR